MKKLFLKATLQKTSTEGVGKPVNPNREKAKKFYLNFELGYDEATEEYPFNGCNVMGDPASEESALLPINLAVLWDLAKHPNTLPPNFELVGWFEDDSCYCYCFKAGSAKFSIGYWMEIDEEDTGFGTNQPGDVKLRSLKNPLKLWSEVAEMLKANMSEFKDGVWKT